MFKTSSPEGKCVSCVWINKFREAYSCFNFVLVLLSTCLGRCNFKKPFSNRNYPKELVKILFHCVFFVLLCQHMAKSTKQQHTMCNEPAHYLIWYAVYFCLSIFWWFNLSRQKHLLGSCLEGNFKLKTFFYDNLRACSSLLVMSKIKKLAKDWIF